ncbi:hypothetical protein E2562_036607 [Oryza meyeriana var. granulata]|uniref:Uncharacterized protein n=1 Tax=Oryza meyeriana var. granulata TaxID=110450 RepID=A0A6G1DCN6_9ORYZ|nr:hypothetical protein E2562_036607 [Oryza meyeriana var. granulata]
MKIIAKAKVRARCCWWFNFYIAKLTLVDFEMDFHVATFGKANMGNIAKYMSLAAVLSIPVNFIFIGFDGKGGHTFHFKEAAFDYEKATISHLHEEILNVESDLDALKAN